MNHHRRRTRAVLQRLDADAHEVSGAKPSLIEIKRDVESFCRKRIGRNLPRVARDEIVEEIAHSVVTRFLTNRSLEFGTPTFWTAVYRDLLDVLRRGRRRDRIFHQAFVPAVTASVVRTSTRELREQASLDFYRALDLLDFKTRNALVLHHVLGYAISAKDNSEPTVCRILGCSEKSARRWIERAMRLLRDAIP